MRLDTRSRTRGKSHPSGRLRRRCPGTPPALSPAVDNVTAVMVGTEETRLVVLRGNSASGKSSLAAGLRERFGRGLAVVGQDNLRRIVLGERDRPGAANIGLIGLTARYALDAGFHVVVEGILYADRYGDMLDQLRADHRGPTHSYYLDVRRRQREAAARVVPGARSAARRHRDRHRCRQRPARDRRPHHARHRPGPLARRRPLSGALPRGTDPAPTMRPTTGPVMLLPAPTTAGQRAADARRDRDAAGCFSYGLSWCPSGCLS